MTDNPRRLFDKANRKSVEPHYKPAPVPTGKRGTLRAQVEPPQTLNPGEMESAVKAACESLDAKQFGRRLYERDSHLWKSDPLQAGAIANRLGWLDSAKDFLAKAGEISQFAREIRDARFTHVVLLGMGGSSLCPEVARETFGDQQGWPKLIMLDNTDPAAVADVATKIDPGHTLFLVASKSGTTTETNCFYRYFLGLLTEKGINDIGSHFVAITDPRTGLVEEARQRGFRRIFENPPDIGGRYSAISYFGLLPMALMGINIQTILAEALRMRENCGPFVPSSANPAIHLGALLGVCEKHGRDKVTFLLSPSIRAFGVWAEQLVAESTGKEGRGLIPVDGEDLGKPEVYGPDRIFVSMGLDDANARKTAKALSALEAQGHPAVRINLRSKRELAAEFLRWEIATAVAGALIGVNPFDEPNVAESKRNTNDLLNEWKQNGTFPEAGAILAGEDLKIYCDQGAAWATQRNRDSLQIFVAEFLGLMQPMDYFAMLAYFLPTAERTRILQKMRQSVRDRAHVATTVGYGPRYLHSTGQLHKGGPERGVFVIFTADSARDLRIPGEDYGFAVLQKAQALGDFRSLASKGRRVIRVHLGSNIVKGLKSFNDLLPA